MKQAISIIFALIFSVWAGVATAQATWLQVEAQPSLTKAQERARAYAARLPDVNGFRLRSGWYAVVLGPYEENDAIARLRALKAQGAIPADGFLAYSSAFTQQFWPVGANALNAPIIELPRANVATTEAVATPAAELPVATEQPVQETRAQALRAEAQLSRQEKLDLQVALQWFGFYNGAIDAAFGPGTRNSMAAWQQSQGFEPTGVLTTSQRRKLIQSYRSVFDSLGLARVQDDVAGITLELPLAMVEFDRYDPPFAHYKPKGDSGVKVLLISQPGDEASLLGLYDIMQTLEIVPLDGQRERKNDSFTLTGQNEKITSYTHARLSGGAVKGFTLIWPTNEDRRREVALKAMLDSFEPIDGVVLPDAYGDGALEQSIDLISGLQIRRPAKSRSGFYIDGQGSVLTTAEAVAGCSRITLDETYDAAIVASDPQLGLALLRPQTPLSPVDYARFQAGVPRLKSEVAVSGYSFEGALGAPSLTFGTLADIKGLRGEDTINRLSLAASPGDTGGPVFDTTGSVLGILLPTGEVSGKRLPDDVSFSADTLAIAEFLSPLGAAPAASDDRVPMAAEDLTQRAADITVLVGCWE